MALKLHCQEVSNCRLIRVDTLVSALKSAPQNQCVFFTSFEISKWQQLVSVCMKCAVVSAVLVHSSEPVSAGISHMEKVIYSLNQKM